MLANLSTSRRSSSLDAGGSHASVSTRTPLLEGSLNGARAIDDDDVASFERNADGARSL